MVAAEVVTTEPVSPEYAIVRRAGARYLSDDLVYRYEAVAAEWSLIQHDLRRAFEEQEGGGPG